MKKSLAVTAIVAVLSSSASFAQGLSIGDAKADTGQLKLSGAIRSRFYIKIMPTLPVKAAIMIGNWRISNWY